MAKTSSPRCPRRISAVLIGRARVTLVGRHLNGPLVLAAAGEEFTPGELEEALRRAVVDKHLRGRVAIGLEPSVEFFSTERRESMPDGQQGSMLDQLVNELGADKVGRELGTSLPADLFSTAIIVPAGPAREARRGLARLGAAQTRLISTTHALHALSQSVHARRKGHAVEIRVLASSGSGIAFLSQDGELLARHVFEYSAAGEHAMLAAARRLLVVARDGLRLDAEPQLILHVGEAPEVAARAHDELGLEALAAPALDLGPELTGIALAQAAFRRGGHINLLQAAAKAVGTEPAEFPLAGVIGVGGVLAGTVMWLNGEASALETRAENVDAENAAVLEHYGTDLFELREQQERHAFAAHVLAAFAKDRARWAPLLLELPRILPPGARMQKFEGSYSFFFSGDDPTAPPPPEEADMNRWCEVNLWAPITTDGGTPPHAGLMAQALQASPAFQNPFRVVSGPQLNLITQGDPHTDVRIRLLTR